MDSTYFELFVLIDVLVGDVFCNHIVHHLTGTAIPRENGLRPPPSPKSARRTRSKPPPKSESFNPQQETIKTLIPTCASHRE
jgi:hypothetical protein